LSAIASQTASDCRTGLAGGSLGVRCCEGKGWIRSSPEVPSNPYCYSVSASTLSAGALASEGQHPPPHRKQDEHGCTCLKCWVASTIAGWAQSPLLPWVQALGVMLLPLRRSTRAGRGHGLRSLPAALSPAPGGEPAPARAEDSPCFRGEPEMLLLGAQSLLALIAMAGWLDRVLLKLSRLWVRFTEHQV